MKELFILPVYKDDKKWLYEKIAGLSYIERLNHHIKRAGIKDFYIYSPEDIKLDNIQSIKDLSLLNCEQFDIILVIRPKTLPEINCLKELILSDLKDDEVLIHDRILAFKPSKDCFELKKLLNEHGFTELRNFLLTFLKPIDFTCKSGKIFDISSPLKIKETEKTLFKGLIKDTEGFMSRYVERPISLSISKRLVNTSITPNQITIISIVIGLIGAGFISISQGFWQILGAFLFLFHSIIDGCDGEIARLKFKESKFGGILDFWGDNIVHAAIFSAIGIEWAARENKAYPLILSAIAVIGTFISASIVYFSTMKKKDGKGPLYTSVSESSKRSKIVKIADYLSRRDFIYLVVILAFYQHLDWFLMATAFGTVAFALTLVWIKMRS